MKPYPLLALLALLSCGVAWSEDTGPIIEAS